MGTHIREIEDSRGDLVEILYYCSQGCYADDLKRRPDVANEGGASPCAESDSEDATIYCAECGVRMNGPDAPLVVNLIGREYGPDGNAIPVNPPLKCPYCGEDVWDGPQGHKLAKCWNYHPETGGTLAFDTMDD